MFESSVKRVFNGISSLKQKNKNCVITNTNCTRLLERSFKQVNLYVRNSNCSKRTVFNYTTL